MDNTFYHILPNGIKLIHRQTCSEVAYTGIMAGAGTRDEKNAESGMAHYIEHCVFKGCTHLTANGEQHLGAKQIIDKVEGIGGEINAYTTKEETVFYAATPVQYLQRVMQTIADLVLRPTFPESETKKELNVIYDEIESYNDSPSELIYDDFEALVFRDHPLAMPILGKRATLKRIAASGSKPLKWMQEHYNPNNMVVFVQANMNFDKVKAIAEHIFTLYHYSAAATHRIPPADTQPLNATYRKHTHQVHVMLGGRAYPLGDDRQLTLYLLNNILGGGGMSSRLNLALREKKGLVYTIESQYTPLSDTGYWSLYFAAEEQHKDECIELCYKQLQTLREIPLSSLQLHRALVQLRGQMAIAAENQENNVLAMAKQMLYYGYAPTWEESYDRIAKTTPQMLQEAAREIYSENRLSTLIYE